MKTKKVIVGVIASTMLSLSVCPIAPVAAAGETVQISVGTAEAEAGKQFTVDVSLADIPSTGIQNLDFAVEYDSTMVTITDVTMGAIAKTGADSADLTSAGAPVFTYSIKNKGYVNLMWATGVDDASYWLKKDGVFCTLTGTVASTASEGDVSSLKIVPVNRKATAESGSGDNEQISCGYFSNGTKVPYDVKATSGSVKVPSGTLSATLRGDADCDSSVRINDAVLILQSISSPDKYGINGSAGSHITAQGMANADVCGGSTGKGGDGVTVNDALEIQKYLLGTVKL